MFVYIFSLVESVRRIGRWKVIDMTKKSLYMEYSNLIKKKHHQTFQYQITIQMMKTMFNTHKVITNNADFVRLHSWLK